MVCAGDVGIESLADLKGKRIGYVKGTPSVNVKTDASLAFSGLDRDSAEAVWFGSYGALKTAVTANPLHCFSSVTTPANTRDQVTSPRGLAQQPLTDGHNTGRARASGDARTRSAKPWQTE